MNKMSLSIPVSTHVVAAEKGVKDGGYIHHLILCKGWLWKRSTGTTTVPTALQYRKRYFELSNVALTYAQNERNMGVSDECQCRVAQ